MDNNDRILSVNNVSVYYHKNSSGFLAEGGRTQVLDGVSFELRRGEILGLVGESGCGKTTLAKAILGMVVPDGGTLQYFPDTIRPQMVFQDPYGSLNPAKQAGWILEEPLKLKGGFTKAQRRERVLRMLERVGMEPAMAGRYPEQLSGGQRQRIAIAGALMQEPELLIADEPVSALDVTIQAQIIELLMKLHEEMGLSILFISHDLRVVYRMCDRVMIMNRGEIVEAGKVQKVYFNPQHEYTKLLLEAAGIHS